MLRKRDLDPDPLRQFENWFEQAVAAAETLPEAMALATVSPEGAPAVRMVLFKGLSESGLEFFTDFRSAKSREMNENPHAAVVFWWPKLQRQVRFAGIVQKLNKIRSDEYFKTRPRGSQIGAWASRQSAVIADRNELTKQIRYFQMKFRGRKVPRPPHWGGYQLIPSTVEYWQGRTYRLHDRMLYRRSEDGSWTIERLSP
jgi:pyridoxamine 5'-phosphate oxidase